MKKKVLFVITKSNWGGAQRYVFDLATNLPKGEFEIVAACGGSGVLIENLKEKNIRVLPVPSFQRDIAVFKEFAALRELLKIFKAERPDVVHLNSSKAGGIGALAARAVGIRRIIFTAHGWPFWEKRNVAMRATIWIASWLTAALSHVTICISNYDLKVAQHMPFVGKKAIRIYNGINPYMKFGSGEKIRSAFPAGVKITGTIGELTHNKNQVALIEEAHKNSAMYVAIVGEGDLRAQLEAKIKKYDLKDRVKLFGFISASEVLHGFDVFALPSLKEGLPYVLLEAKLAGLPIVANRVGGVGEILDAKDLREFSLEQMLHKTVLLYKS